MSYIRGGLIFLSKEKMDKKPNIFTAGGFTVEAPDGRQFAFDWCEMSCGAEVNDEGQMIFDVDFRDFDYEFFEDTNKESLQGMDIEDIAPEYLSKCKLVEAFYECFDDEENEDSAPLTLMEFGLYNDNGVFEFPKEELDRYDKEDAIYRSEEEKQCILNQESK